MSQPRPILDVASDLGIDRRFVVPYGDDKAKIRLEAREYGRPPGKLVLVSAITPTSAGEGKTTTSIGLAQGLAKIGEKVCIALREPSLGPIFGMKGGATCGGKSVLVPGEDINLHFTGDFHAITTANNLIAALLDNHLQHGNALGIDARRILWKRVMDMNDRSLRRIIIGLGGPIEGVPRETGFDITAASEVMASLCLAEDAEDLRVRLDRLLLGLTAKQEPVTVKDLGIVGSLVVVLKDALMPNLVQSIEGVPAFVHGGPFANIAHGCNSVIATKMALAHGDWVVTEAGFAFDLGGEKFFDIKCRSAGLSPSAVVIVATVRALKRHGNVPNDTLATPDPAAVESGVGNLLKHVESAQAFGKPVVVAINQFATDSDDEIEVVRRACAGVGVPCVLSNHYGQGGDGAVDLARAVVEQAEKTPSPLRPLYELSEPIPTKIEKIARTMYGARNVVFSTEAEKDLKLIRKLGGESLPLCVAKTPTSLTDDPNIFGRPEGLDITVRRLILSAGAGFVVPLLGDIMRMPGLPASPQALRIDFAGGEIKGLMAG